MPRLDPIDSTAAAAKTRSLLDGVQKALGMTPNMMLTMAHSPAVLEGYLGFGKALGGGGLSAKLREQVALAVAGANRCDYCASAHTAIGRHLGLDLAELDRNLHGTASDAKSQAALDFARAVVSKQGRVGDDDLRRVRAAGYGDDEIAEVIAHVALNILTNYFNQVAQTAVDFPLVKAA